MGQPSAAWIAEQRAAEQAVLDRFGQLDALLIRAQRRIGRLDTRVAVLGGLPNGDPAQVAAERDDLRVLVAIAAWCAANPDKVRLPDHVLRPADPEAVR